MTLFSAFLKDETGAVTVDWVVLTAAVVLLGMVVLTYVRPAVSSLASDIGVEILEASSDMQDADPTP
jgi:Flp pilus assembly pilin Flp